MHRPVFITCSLFQVNIVFKHRQKTVATRRNRPHPVRQALEEPSVFVVTAIADAYSPCMPPDLGRQEQEPQTRRGQRGVQHRSDLSTFFAIEQLQPAVQVVGQHRDLKPECSSSSSARRDVPSAQRHCWLPWSGSRLHPVGCRTTPVREPAPSCSLQTPDRGTSRSRTIGIAPSHPPQQPWVASHNAAPRSGTLSLSHPADTRTRTVRRRRPVGTVSTPPLLTPPPDAPSCAPR